MDRKVALVLGATGSIGGEIAAALLARGWAVRGRDVAGAAARWRGRHGDIEWVAGDALVRDDVVRVAQGAAAIVHAGNPPGYRH